MLTILTHLVAALVGGVVSYLVLRNNPKIKNQADSLADKADAKISK